MKKLLLFLFAPLLIISACSKSNTVDPVKQAATDDATIQTYLAANPNITAKKDPSGLYYQILAEGAGDSPTLTSTITVNYTGKLLSGAVFDTGAGFTTPLNGNIISGWKIGIPYAKLGSRILLIIPSGLAYGSLGSGSIPPNTVLIFTIDLTAIK